MFYIYISQKHEKNMTISVLPFHKLPINERKVISFTMKWLRNDVETINEIYKNKEPFIFPKIKN